MTGRFPRSLILGALALLALAGPVAAADLDEYPPPRFEGRSGWREPAPPPPRFVQGPEFRGPGGCRVFVKRRIDPYGDEVVRRVRVCDDESGYRDGPRWGGPRPWAHHRHWDDEPGPGRW